MSNWNRRTFIKSGALGTAAFTLLPMSSYLDLNAKVTTIGKYNNVITYMEHELNFCKVHEFVYRR